MSKQQDLLDHEQLRLVLAAFFMHGEISRSASSTNEELVVLALRRADILMQQHAQSKPDGG
jgi:hypothetical protein